MESEKKFGVGQKDPKERTKKKFDKKAWREKKYSKKVRVDSWQEKRGLSIKRRYKKLRRKEEKRLKASENNPNLLPLGQLQEVESSSQGCVGEANESLTRPDENSSLESNAGTKGGTAKFTNKPNRRKNLLKHNVKLKKEREEEKRKAMESRLAAMKKYKEGKAIKAKKLCLKTKKGQPIMAGRIELLLDKIKEQT